MCFGDDAGRFSLRFITISDGKVFGLFFWLLCLFWVQNGWDCINRFVGLQMAQSELVYNLRQPPVFGSMMLSF